MYAKNIKQCFIYLFMLFYLFFLRMFILTVQPAAVMTDVYSYA